MARRSMKSTGGGNGLDALIRDIMAGAGGEDGRLKSLWKAFRENVPLPADAFVIGEPVSVVGIDYDGNTRRGLTARCRRGDGSEYVISAADVEFPERSEGARRVAAFRKWLHLDPRPEGVPSASGRKRQHKAEPDDLDLDGPVELIALSVKDPSVRCRIPGSGRVITLRAGGLLTVVPGEIVTVKPRKRWQYAGHPYLSGEIVKTRRKTTM